MNTKRLCRCFVLLLSFALVMAISVAGTTAYIFARSSVVVNTFVFDASIFPPIVLPDQIIDLPNTGDSSSLLLSGVMLAGSVSTLLMIRRRKK